MGGSFTLRVVNLPASQPAVVLLGQSRTSWVGYFALPYDLTSLGLTGRSLQVDLIDMVPLAPQGGVGRLVLDLPLMPDLVGAIFYNQALVRDPAANPGGATLSNGGEGVLGAR